MIATQRRLGWLVVVVVAAAGSLAYRANDEPRAGAPPLEIELAGCAEVMAGPRCAVEPGARVTVFVPGAGRVEGPPGAESRQTAAGWLVSVPADARQEVRLDVWRAGRRLAWHLPLVHRERHAFVAEANNLLQRGKLAEALAVVDGAWPKLPPGDRAHALVVRAKVARIRGDEDGALRWREEAARQAAAGGMLSTASRQHLALAFAHLFGRRHLVRARAELELATPIDAMVMAEADLLRGYLAQESGDLGAALEGFSRSAARAERFGLTTQAWGAKKQRAALLGRLGRFPESLAEFADLSTELDQSPCARALFLTSFAWQQLMAREAGALPAAPDAAAQLEEALILNRGCAEGTPRRPNVLVNLALARLQAGRLAEAAELLAQAAPEPRSFKVPVELWRLDLLGRLALVGRQPAAALIAYARMEELAARTLAAEASWSATVGRARAEAALGHRAAAIASYRRAETLLDDQLLQVPLGEGRGEWLAAREAATGELLAALLAAGERAEAVATARRARIRTLALLHRQSRLAALAAPERQRWEEVVGRFLAARDELEHRAEASWSLAASELAASRTDRERTAGRARAELTTALALLAQAPSSDLRMRPLAAPAPGEAILGYYPLTAGHTEWLGYALAGDTVLAERLGAVPSSAEPEELARRLLAPFAAVLGPATRVRILATGALADVDFHVLPLGGAPLGATRPVTYSLDLPAAPETSGGAAVVVADPRGNLPEARAEGEEVARLLQTHYEVRALVGPASATGPRLRQLLAGAALFHYAGHGRFAGGDGLASELPLGGGTSLGLADVLALPRAPRYVVLSGCETGREARVGLGLAQAFVLAGSRAVVASTREVDDRLARAVAVRLHRGDAGDLAEALRQAQLAIAREQPATDWAALRVIVP